MSRYYMDGHVYIQSTLDEMLERKIDDLLTSLSQGMKLTLRDKEFLIEHGFDPYSGEDLETIDDTATLITALL